MNTIINLAVIALACMVGLSMGYYPGGGYAGGMGGMGGYNMGMGIGGGSTGGGGIFGTLIFLFVFIFIIKLLFNNDGGLLGNSN